MSVARFIERHGDTVAIIAVGLIAFAARYHALGDKPYWLDELITVRRADQDAASVVMDSLRNHHLPTYFLLIWTVLPLGLNEAVVRLPSVIFGALSASLVFSIGNRLAGRAAGLVAGLLMALNPFQVQMGQEARSYAMVTCLILLGLWGLIRILDDAAEAARGAKTDRRSGWTAYFCGTAGALLVLPIAIPWLVAANLGVVILALRGSPRRAAFLRQWLLVQTAIAAVAAPGMIALAFVDQGRFVHAFDWIPPSVTETLKSSMAATYLFRISNIASFDLLPTDVPGFGALIAVFAAFGAWTMRRSPYRLLILGVALLALPLTLTGISVFKSVVIPRYFAWGAGPFFIFAGIGAASLSRRFQAAACTAVLAASLISVAPYYGAETKPRWDLAVQDVSARLRPDDVLLTADGWIPYMFGAFKDRLVDVPSSPLAVTQNVDEAAERLASGHRVWAVYGRVGQGVMEPYDKFMSRIAVLGVATIEMDEGQHIRVLRFDPESVGSLTNADDSGSDSSDATPE